MNLKSLLVLLSCCVLFSCGKDDDDDKKPVKKALAFFIEQDNVSRLWYIAADGSSFEKVLPDDIGTSMNNPTWSFDGKTIYFIKKGTINGVNGVYAIKPNGKGYIPIYIDTDTQQRNFYQLTASGDNENVIFSLEIPRTGRKVIEIYKMCPCGQSVNRLTTFEVPEPGKTINTEAYAGSFSPDDSLLVFTQSDPSLTGKKNVKIYTINVYTKNLVLLKTISAEDAASCTPNFSPDGKTLLLSIDGFIHTMKSNGDDLKKLGNQKGFRPMWDINGREFYFSSSNIPNVEPGIYKADINLLRIEPVIKRSFSGKPGGFAVNPVP